MTTALLARLFPGSRSAPRLRCEHPALYCPKRGGARSEHAVSVARRGGRRCCYVRPLRRCQIHGCTARPFRRQQGARAPRCTVALTGAAQVLALFLSRNEVRPAACPPFLPNPPLSKDTIPCQNEINKDTTPCKSFQLSKDTIPCQNEIKDTTPCKKRERTKGHNSVLSSSKGHNSVFISVRVAGRERVHRRSRARRGRTTR